MAPHRHTRSAEARMQRDLAALLRALSGEGGLERLVERRLSAIETQMEGMLTRALSQFLPQLLAQMLGGGSADLLGGLLAVPKLAQGGVVDGAQLLALGGEAGPEAVLPLTRLADGSLGVRSDAAGSPPVIINLTLGGEETGGGDTALTDEARTALAGLLSRSLDQALDQAVADRLRTQLRDGGMLSANGGEPG